jgi:hypothetical protein
MWSYFNWTEQLLHIVINELKYREWHLNGFNKIKLVNQCNKPIIINLRLSETKADNTSKMTQNAAN